MTDFVKDDLVLYVAPMSVRTNQMGRILKRLSGNGYSVYFPELGQAFWCHEEYLRKLSPEEIDSKHRLFHAMKYL